MSRSLARKTNGVDASDYARITTGIERWDEWCEAWSAAADEHVFLAKASADAGHARSAGEAYARAATYYHFAKFLFVHDLQQSAVAHGSAVAALELAAPLLRPAGRRVVIPFEVGTLAGLLRTPGGPGPHPTVLLVAGLDSAKEEFREIERAFLDRGMATFAFDGPGQGEGEVFALRPEWEEVGRVVVQYLRGLTEVDGERMGVWGVSLGGFYAARIASAGLGLRGVVTLCGPYDVACAWDNLNDLTRRAFQVRGQCATVDDARQLATMLRQAEDMGTSLGETLSVFSDDMRSKRMLRAEEKALALPAKMMIPLILFIFPCLIGVLMLPAGVKIAHAFHHLSRARAAAVFR